MYIGLAYLDANVFLEIPTAQGLHWFDFRSLFSSMSKTLTKISIIIDILVNKLALPKTIKRSGFVKNYCDTRVV